MSLSAQRAVGSIGARQDHSLPEAIDMAQEAGRKYVTIASSVLAGK